MNFRNANSVTVILIFELKSKWWWRKLERRAAAIVLPGSCAPPKKQNFSTRWGNCINWFCNWQHNSASNKSGILRLHSDNHCSQGSNSYRQSNGHASFIWYAIFKSIWCLLQPLLFFSHVILHLISTRNTNLIWMYSLDFSFRVAWIFC